MACEDGGQDAEQDCAYGPGLQYSEWRFALVLAEASQTLKHHRLLALAFYPLYLGEKTGVGVQDIDPMANAMFYLDNLVGIQ